MTINFATEEAIEDAFVAYLTTKLSGEVKVLAALTADQVVYPAVVVGVRGNDNINESAGWNVHRAFDVEIRTAVEAKDVQDGAGVGVTLREKNRALREQVLDALTASDLVEQVNATGLVRISLVVFGRIERSVEGHTLETIIPLAVTA
jgi:hypothetical protein